MNIFEIMVVAEASGGSWIRRKSWAEGHAIMPTDNSETAMVMITPYMIQPRWDLCKSDLIATDWETAEAEYRRWMKRKKEVDDANDGSSSACKYCYECNS